MKIGIVTFWTSKDNYGQLLQCWALQQYLIQRGHSPFLIRFIPKYSAKGIRGTYIWKALSIVKHSLLGLANGQCLMTIKNRRRQFNKFREQYIIQSELVYKGLQSLQANPPIAGAYITGSDQVWAHSLTDKNAEGYFLDFGPSIVKRFSYAASFAMANYPIDMNSKLAENLKRFNAISVREEEGVDICRRVGFEAKHVLDPTFLLSADTYRGIASKPKYTKKYLYVYYVNILSADEIYFDDIKKYVAAEGLELVCTPASGMCEGRELVRGVKYDYATIPDWITNIDNASFMVTTSFHGVVFSLKLHTPFVFVPLKGERGRGNNRVIELLNSLGLTSCVMTDNNSLQQAIECNLDWDVIDGRLGDMIEESCAFLNANL